MVKGKFKDISFIELLQLMQITRKTGRMEVTVEAKWAMIIFKEGTIWHVEPRGFRGATSEEILYSLIALVDGEFAFQLVQVLPALERTVNISTEALIMEGSKRIDDENALAAEVVGDEAATASAQLTHLLKFKPGAEAKVRYVPQTVKRILQLIDGQRSIADVIQQSQLDSAQAAQIIKELITQDVVERIDPKLKAPPVSAEE